MPTWIFVLGIATGVAVGFFLSQIWGKPGKEFKPIAEKIEIIFKRMFPDEE